MSLNPAGDVVSIRSPWTPVYGRGQANTALVRLERDGEAVSPSSATYTLNGPTGTAIVDAQAATVGTGTLSYALTSTELSATAELSAGYLERWVITYSSGDAQTWERTAIVGRRSLSPPIGQTDLEQRFPNLTRQRTGTPIVTSYQGFIDQAWADILGHLLAQSILPNRLVQPDALRAPMMHLTLHLIYESFAAGQPERGNWMELARFQWERYTEALRTATAQMDADDDGLPDAEGTLRTGLRDPVIRPDGAPIFISPRYAATRGW